MTESCICYRFMTYPENARTDYCRPDVALETLKNRTLKLSLVEGCAWAVMSGFGEQFIGPFAVFLKANDFLMSLLITLPILLGALAQVAGGYLVERLGHRKPVCVITAAVQAFGYLLLFWLPYLFPYKGAQIAITLATLMIISNNMGVPGFNSMMGDLIPPETRGRYFSKRSALIILTMLLSMLASGRVVSFFECRGHIWLGFWLVFTLAFVMRSYSAFLLTRYYDPPFNPSTKTTITLMEFLRKAHRTNLGRFTLVMAIMSGATNIASPFFTQYMLRDMHWTKDQFAICTAVMLLTQFLFIRWWGHISDRHGNLVVIRTCCLIIPVAPLLWAFSTDFHAILGAQVVSGIAWAGFNLSVSNFLYDAIPANERHRLFSYYAVINGICILLGGSVAGAWLAANMPSSYHFGGLHLAFLSSLPVVFIVSSLIRILVGVILFPLFKEVRRTEPITSGQILWRLSTGEPLMNQITNLLEILPKPFKSDVDSPERRA